MTRGGSLILWHHLRIIARPIPPPFKMPNKRGTVKSSMVRSIYRSLRCIPNALKNIKANLPCLLELGGGIGMATAGLLGHPVHVATGLKFLDGTDDTDFTLPGRLPLTWRRVYNSHNPRPGPLGPGWSLPYGVTLVPGHAADGAPTIAYYDDIGRRTVFPAPAPGHAEFSIAEGYTLYHNTEGHYLLHTQDGLYRVFEAPDPATGTAPLLLRRIEDRNGNYLALRYDRECRLHELADTTGRRLRCHYREQRLTAVELVEAAPGESGGILVRYEYDALGALSRVVDREGRGERRFAYADGVMVEQTFPGGLVCHYAWEHNGTGPEGARRVLRQWTNDGEAWDLRYERDDNGGRTVATDHLGRTRHWRWNAEHLIVEHRDALGRIWRFAWDEFRQLRAATDPNGATWHYDYDDHGLPARSTDPLGRSEITHWIGHLAVPSCRVATDGGVHRYTYDDSGNLTGEIAADGGETHYAYDSGGQVIRITDARGGVHSLTWTARGQLASHTDCSGKTTRYDYDGYGHPRRIVDALGQETEFSHDPMGRPVAAKSADGATSCWQYDAAGRRVGEIDPLARQTRYALDLRGRLVRRIDAAGRHVAYGYDRAQRLTTLVPENGRAYDFSYDDADRLTEERRPDGTRLVYEYDPAGHVVAVIHHPGIGDDFFTDLETGAGQVPANAPRRTELVRDAAGQLIEKRCGNQLSRYRYDPAGRLIEATRLEKPADDAEAQAKHTVRFTYDALGRVVSETSTDLERGDSQTLRHQHDTLGNRIRTDLPDLPGRAARSLHYLHYGSGHLHQVRLGLDQNEEGTPTAWQVVADLERDDLHREILRSQGKLSTRFLLDPLGRRLGSWTKPRGGYGLQPDSATGFDAARAQGASLIEGLTRAYRYDPTGELRESRHGFKGETRYEYDPTGRIESVQRHNHAGQRQTERFAYDPAGNLLDAASAQAPTGRGYVRDNRVRVFEDKRYAYDGFGRLVEKRSGKHTLQRFEWDEEDRLRAVTTTRQPGTEQETKQTVRFEYDALGRRILKEDAFGATRFIWEGMRLIEERRGAHATAYIYEPDSYVPMARIDTSANSDEPAQDESSGTPAQVLYFHTDPSGLPEELSDDKGRIRWRAAYKTWGNTVVERWEAVGLDGRPAEFQRSEPKPANEPPPIEQNLRFQGQYLDRDTGLHYNTFRYYDPDIGRFISPDPIGLAGGENLYAYAPNPVSWIDPWGWAASADLPQLKGQSVSSVEKTLTKNGFSLDKKTSTGNQTWSHPDGSTVRIDPYGNQSMTMKNGDPLPKSGANAHVHKYDPGEVKLNDHGITSNIPDETHIGIKNPKDYPAKRGRPHGCGA